MTFHEVLEKQNLQTQEPDWVQHSKRPGGQAESLSRTSSSWTWIRTWTRLDQNLCQPEPGGSSNLGPAEDQVIEAPSGCVRTFFTLGQNFWSPDCSSRTLLRFGSVCFHNIGFWTRF